jgi:hypothetical protein
MTAGRGALIAYQSIVRNDVPSLLETLTEDAFVAIPGHEGSGKAHVESVIGRLHAKALRTWSDQSADVLESTHHSVVLDRWIADSDGDGIDEHVTVLLADKQADGRFGLLSIYGYNEANVRRLFD